MKRMISTFACAFAMLMLTNIPAQAQANLNFLGTLQRDQPWHVDLDNSNNLAPAAVTIFYLGKTLDFDIFTVAGATSFTVGDSKFPRGIRRIIIEVSVPRGMSVAVLVIQGGTGFSHPCTDGCRLALDIN